MKTNEMKRSLCAKKDRSVTTQNNTEHYIDTHLHGVYDYSEDTEDEENSIGDLLEYINGGKMLMRKINT